MSIELVGILVVGFVNLGAVAFGAGRMSAKIAGVDARLLRLEGLFDRFLERLK